MNAHSSMNAHSGMHVHSGVSGGGANAHSGMNAHSGASAGGMSAIGGGSGGGNSGGDVGGGWAFSEGPADGAGPASWDQAPRPMHGSTSVPEVFTLTDPVSATHLHDSDSQLDTSSDDANQVRAVMHAAHACEHACEHA